MIRAASLDSGNPDRDAFLRTEACLNTEQHPEFTFRSTRVEPLTDQMVHLVGELTICRVTREVILDSRY